MNIIKKGLGQQYTLLTLEQGQQKLKKFIHTNIKTEEEITALIDTICQFQYNDILQRRLGCFLLQLLTKRKLSNEQIIEINEFLMKQFSNDENGGGQELFDVQYSADVALTFSVLKDQLFQDKDKLFNGLKQYTETAMTDRDLSKAKTCLRSVNYLRVSPEAENVDGNAAGVNKFIEDVTRQVLRHSLEKEYGRDVQFYQELLQSAYESDLHQGLDETQLENLFQTIINNLKSQNPATQDNAIRCLDKYFGLFASAGFLDRLRALNNAKCDAYLDANLPQTKAEPEISPPESLHSVLDLHNSQEEKEELEVPEPPPKKFKVQSPPKKNELWFLENDDLIIYHIEDEPKIIEQNQNQWFVNFEGKNTQITSNDQKQVYYQIKESEIQSMLKESDTASNQISNLTQQTSQQFNNKIQRPDSPYKGGNILLNKRKNKQNAFMSRFNIVPFTQELLIEGEISNELLQQLNISNLNNTQIINLLSFLMKQKPCYEKLDYINKDKLNDIVSLLTLHGYVDQMQQYIKESMKYSKFTPEQSKDIILGMKKLSQKHPLYQWGQNICQQLQKELNKIEKDKYQQQQALKANQEQANEESAQLQQQASDSVLQNTIEVERMPIMQ